MTDLERRLTETLHAHADLVQFAPETAAAAARLRARKSRRTRYAAGLAAVACVAAVGVGIGLAQWPQDQATPAPATRSVALAPVRSLADAAGRWRPVQLLGVDVPDVSRPQHPELVLTPYGHWGGSDGCNTLAGYYSVAEDGGLASTAEPTTDRACANVDLGRVMATGTTLMRSGDVLVVRRPPNEVRCAPDPEVARFELVAGPAAYRMVREVGELAGTWRFVQVQLSPRSPLMQTDRGELRVSGTRWTYHAGGCPRRGGTIDLSAQGSPERSPFPQSMVYDVPCSGPEASSYVALPFTRTAAFEDPDTLVLLDDDDREVARLSRSRH